MQKIIEIKNLFVQVQGKTILKDISLSFNPGTTHFLIGPNGSGKTTLARVLIGDRNCVIKEGSIFFDGQNIASFSPDKRSCCGLFYAFQHPCAIPGLSVFSFLKSAYCARFQKNIDTEKFRKVLYKNMDLLEIDKSFVFRDLNVGFSGGEKKLLEMLQILILEPRFAILDEIDSGLDVDTCKIVLRSIEYIKKKMPSTSFLIITHNQNIFQKINPDYVHIFCDGSVACSGGFELSAIISRNGYNAFL